VHDDEIAQLRAQIERLQAEHDSRVPAERYEEQSQSLALAKSEAAELQETIANMQTSVSQNNWRLPYEASMKQLEAQVSQWKGLCEVLRRKDERTDDEVRRRAAEEPELRAENKELRTKILGMETEIAEMRREKSTLEERVEQARSVQELNDQLTTKTSLFETRIADLQTNLERVQDESLLKEENATIRASLLEHRAQDLQLELDRLEAEKDDTAAREETLRADYTRLQAEALESEKEVRTLRAELERVQTKLIQQQNLYNVSVSTQCVCLIIDVLFRFLLRRSQTHGHAFNARQAAWNV
jgi:chromosome segregation ATPase